MKKLAKTMMQAAYGLGHNRQIWWKTLVDRLFAPADNNGRQQPLLDPRDLNDHMKRDMGYLDGRATPKRRR